MHHHSSGRQGSPSFGELAVAFNEAKARDDPLLEDLQNLAATARTARPMLPRKTSPFGPKKRDVTRELRREKRRHIVTAAEAPAALADMRPSSSSSSSGTLAEAMSLARRHKLLMSQRQKHRKSDEQRLRNFEATAGLPMCKGLVESLPGLGLTAEDLTAIPTATGQCFSLNSRGVDFATDATAWASKNHKVTNLGASLQAEWFQRHCPLLHSEAPVIPDGPKERKRCLEAGVCLCGQEGKRLFRLRNIVLREMKAAFREKHRKEKLAQGNIVMRLYRESAAAASTDQSSHLAELWFHIGAMYFSPYRPTFMQLHRARSVDSEINLPDRATLLEARLRLSSESPSCPPKNPLQTRGFSKPAT